MSLRIALLSQRHHVERQPQLLGRSGCATLVNNGSLNIGNTASNTLNSVFFGGLGAPAVIINSGVLNVGANSASSGNSLTISNASVSAGFVKVRQSNSVVFAAGTLSAGGMDTDPGANNSNEFVVGDGTSAAFYDIGCGRHRLSHILAPPVSWSPTAPPCAAAARLRVPRLCSGTFVPGFANSVGSIFHQQ